VTGIVFHKTHRINWHHKRHTYLVDVGSGIEIQQMEVSDLYENRMLDPPFPETRFFEIEIDDMKNWGSRTFVFQHITPVKANRKPDWHILKFRIRRGSWSVTERLHSKSANGEIQWLYTDDFNILFISSGGRHDGEMLLNLITGKLDAIAKSIRSGARIPSEFENQLSCRTAFDTMFTDGVDGAFRDAVIYQQHASAISGELDAKDPQAAKTAISSNHGRVAVKPEQAAELHVDLSQIDELQDLSWLNE
jgi:hypothetical protein